MAIDTVGLDLSQILSYYSQRQEVIASNIANADTPGYRTQDVSMPAFSGPRFAAAMSEFLPAASEVSGLTVRDDGNNVNIDREARLLAENNMRFNVASQVLRSQLRNLRSAIEEGK